MLDDIQNKIMANTVNSMKDSFIKGFELGLRVCLKELQDKKDLSADMLVSHLESTITQMLKNKDDYRKVL